ncbi:YaiI/YqxD family protein [Virgibacillus necropolis]|uniref:YaiI/YqxD family protein n=1 Tax=Virgibacillus necropolis TaxID=163877 RepID=UPI00384CE2CE
MKIYVDADACPVKDSIISIAADAEIPVILVKSFAHYSHGDTAPGVETTYVDTGADSADFRIMQMAEAKDIIITQDYGLASLALGKGCIVLHHKGFEYTQENIDQLLHTRYTSAMARKSGKRTKGPKAFTEEDQQKFSNLLLRKLEAK